VAPLKAYIAKTYGDPEKYNEECNTLNRLRQDMRGAGKDSAAGRDLLYRYYGQLELLDLRFPVEERGVRVGFTWCVDISVPVLVKRRNDLLLCCAIVCISVGSAEGADFFATRLGTMPSHTNRLRNTPSPLKRHPSSSTSPPSTPAMPQTRIARRSSV